MPEGQEPEEGAMSAAKTIVENRVNGLGVAESVVQSQGDTRLIVELPGVNNPDQAVETLRSTGQLEFVDPAGAPLEPGHGDQHHESTLAPLPTWRAEIAGGERRTSARSRIRTSCSRR